MGSRAEMLRWILASSLLVECACVRAETNAVAPTREAAPAGYVKPAVTASGLPDPDEFFSKYKLAVGQAQRGQTQSAAITMDLLTRTLGSSPWMEVAMLKHAQLLESSNEQSSEEVYQLLRQRIINAPYFQGNAERVNVFAVALQGAVDAGITRLRIRRVRAALVRYHSRYFEYPESLTKLAILGYLEMENLYDAKNTPIRYIPASPQMTPFISYKRYEPLEEPPPDPFIATSPRLESTSQISDNPPRYTALIKLPGRREPTRVEEDQTVQGFFVAAIARGGAILSTPTRVLVLVTPE